MSAPVRVRFGAGPLSRAAALVYTLLVTELLLLLTTVPSLALLALLDRDASNIAPAALCLLPLGPAGSAALYALRHRRLDLTDLRPGPAFWRGYRLNLRPALSIWAPSLAWLTMIGVSLANLPAAGVPRWWAGLLVVTGAVATLWAANALVITSLFTFRAVDVARLAAYFLLRTRGVTLANACLLIVAGAVTVLSSEAVLALLGAVFALALLHGCRPMITVIEQEFTK